MKVKLSSFLFFLLFPVLAVPAKKFVSANTGSDTNGGTTWADAYLTLGKLNGNLSAGDSAICVGTFTEELLATFDGTSGNKIVLMDSLSFTDGLNLTNPDTTALWSAIIDAQSTRGRCIRLGGDDFLTIIGFDVLGSTNHNLDFDYGANDNLILQCRSRAHGDGIGDLVSQVAPSPNDSLVSCLLLGDNAVVTGLMFTADVAGSFVALNNTFYGDFTAQAFRTEDDGSVTLKNNIFYNTSAASADLAALVSGQGISSVVDWDNNLWYAPNATNTWNFNSTTFDLLATWVDSVNNYDADGEANALNSDPSLQSVATTAFIDTGSNAYDAAENNAWNDATKPSIGYYQPSVAAAPSLTTRRRFIITNDE